MKNVQFLGPKELNEYGDQDTFIEMLRIVD
jgi:hypothetical protein